MLRHLKSFAERWLHMSFAVVFAGGLVVSAAGQDLRLFDFTQSTDQHGVVAHNVSVAFANDSLVVTTAHQAFKPAVILELASDHQNWAGYSRMVADVRNLGRHPINITVLAENPKYNGWNGGLGNSIDLAPGASGALEISLNTFGPRVSPEVKLDGMVAGPNDLGRRFNPYKVTRLSLAFSGPRQAGKVEIANIRLDGVYDNGVVLSPSQFFPFVDGFGQYIHADWTGKVKSVDDLKRQRQQEADDMAEHPGPADWDKYGGWSAGPQLRATGFFRTEKYNGKWWFVDPDGKLFWSHGIDVLRIANVTRISGRENYFKDLPDKNSSLGQFYTDRSQELHKPWLEFDFTQANFLRKYGPDWQNITAKLAHRRMRSWGMNTVGPFSIDSLYLSRNTPYVVQMFTYNNGPKLGSKFPDVFDPHFRNGLRARLAEEQKTSALDPWCIGYFVDNEMDWGKILTDTTHLGQLTLKSPAGQPAKNVFVADLKSRYGTIAQLNQAWQTDYGSWDALLQSTDVPNSPAATEDLALFTKKVTSNYFQTIRDEIKRVAPNHLYMGCKFLRFPLATEYAAAQFCDVVSYDLYTQDVSDLRLPPGAEDKPLIVAEFHFGARDRGVFGATLQPTRDQKDRAAHYLAYLHSALDNPHIVGAYFFKYFDDPVTARNDGENYQDGFVGICDRPHYQTIQASREVGYHLYQLRTTAQ